MGQVNCLYCGERFPDDAARCPSCNAPSHYQQKGFRLGAQRRFILLFIAFVSIVLALALWLPR